MGCGERETSLKGLEQNFPGYWPILLDIDPKNNPDIEADGTNIPLPTDSVDAVQASHVLEHIPRLRVIMALTEWNRVLRPDGDLHILVPDVKWACRRVLKSGVVDQASMAIFWGGGDGGSSAHHSGWTLRLLRGMLEELGMVVQKATLRPFQIVFGEKNEMEAEQVYLHAKKERSWGA